MRKPAYLIATFLLLATLCLQAQPSRKYIKVIISPDHADWTYDIGEAATFTITALRNNVPIEGAEIDYAIGPDAGFKSLTLWDEGVLTIKNGEAKVRAKKMDEPGFVRCSASVEVDGQAYNAYVTVGFAPEDIEPTTTLPDDFESFWDEGKAALAEIPVDPVLRLLPERSTDKVDVYHVELNNIQGSLYGILCRPKASGSYPAILYVPGAGVRPYYGQVETAEEGFITFSIGIHGIPVDLDPKVYQSLRLGALHQYFTTNLDNKDKAYYRRVYLGCVRAVDFVTGLDAYDGENLAVTGGSQGGALSIVTAGLDSRVKYLAAFFPALSDLTGFMHGRAGGWPQLFTDEYTNQDDKIATSKYYDVVNFARYVQQPGWYSWGYNDNVCPPASMYAAYNVLDAEKELHIYQEAQHWTFPEQRKAKQAWLVEQLR